MSGLVEAGVLLVVAWGIVLGLVLAFFRSVGHLRTPPPEGKLRRSTEDRLREARRRREKLR